MIRRKTWTYVKRTEDMNPVPYKWNFRAKAIDADNQQFLYKARCVLRSDLQEPYMDYDPEDLYSPVAPHEGLRMVLSIAANSSFITEGGRV